MSERTRLSLRSNVATTNLLGSERADPSALAQENSRVGRVGSLRAAATYPARSDIVSTQPVSQRMSFCLATKNLFFYRQKPNEVVMPSDAAATSLQSKKEIEDDHHANHCDNEICARTDMDPITVRDFDRP